MVTILDNKYQKELGLVKNSLLLGGRNIKQNACMLGPQLVARLLPEASNPNIGYLLRQCDSRGPLNNALGKQDSLGMSEAGIPHNEMKCHYLKKVKY